MAGIFCRAERGFCGAAVVVALLGVGFAGLEIWSDGRRREAGVVGDALRVDGVAGVAACFLVALLSIALLWLMAPSVPSLSRSIAVAALVPAVLDASDFELVVKSINLGLTRECEVVLDARLNGSAGP